MSDITFETASEQMKEIINAVGKHSFGILVKKAYNATDAADAYNAYDVLLAIKKGPTLRALIRTDNKIEAIDLNVYYY